jgi:hypothetical protein
MSRNEIAGMVGFRVCTVKSNIHHGLKNKEIIRAAGGRGRDNLNFSFSPFSRAFQQRASHRQGVFILEIFFDSRSLFPANLLQDGKS